MPNESTLGVHIIGDARSLKAALGEASAATEKFAAGYRAQFASMDAATLNLALAQDKLAVATARYGAESRGAAAAALTYRRAVEEQQASHLAGMQKVGRGITTFVTAPVAVAAYEAAKMGVEFNRQMLLIQTQAGASAAEVKNLTGQVLKMAPAVGMGPTQLAQGLYHLESIGLRNVKAMQTLRIAALAAGMGIANLEDVTTALGGVVVTGIRGAQNYETAMATLTATVGAGNMRFEDLAGSIGNVAPAASAAGVSLPELGAAMATLTDRGFSADEAATRLRMSLSLIQSPSEKAKKALKDMGVDANSLGAMLRQPGGLLKVLETLNHAIERVGPARGNRDLLAGFGGGKSGLGIQTLVQSLNQGLSSYQQKLQDVSAGERKYADNQKAYMESPSFKLHQALATIETDLTKIGQDILPEIAKGASAVKAFADAFEKLPGPVKDGIGLLLVEFAVGGPLLLGIAAATRAVGTLRTSFGLLPAAAGPAAAASGAEIAAGVGAGVATAETRVASLRGTLLGLGTLAIAPIVIPIEVKFGGKERDWITKHAGLLGNAGKALLDIATAGGAVTGGNIVQDLGGGAAHSLGGMGGGGAPIGGRNTTPTAADEAAAKAAAGRVRPGTTPPTTTVRGGGSGGGGAETPFRPSRVAALNLALAKNPNDRAAIEAKLAYDREAAAFAERRIAEGRGNKSLVQQLQAVYADENSLETQLASMAKKHADAARKNHDKAKKAAETLTVPIDLQLEQAKADASGVHSRQVKAAEAIKRWAEGVVHGQKATKQQLIDAYNLIAQENSVIGTDTHKAAEKVKESSRQFLAGLTGLSRATKVELEQRFAQVQAHNGYPTRAVGAGGHAVTITGPVHVHGVKDVDGFLKELRRKSKSSVVQTRGRHGGVSVLP